MRPGASSKWLTGLMFAAATAAAQTAAPPVSTPAAVPGSVSPATTAAPPSTAPAPPSTAGAAAAWKPFQELAFLAGSWTGGASLGPRFGGRVARFGPELGGAFFVVRGSTILAADEGGRRRRSRSWAGSATTARRVRRDVFFSNGVSRTFDASFCGACGSSRASS